jgi:hypothetical protein
MPLLLGHAGRLTSLTAVTDAKQSTFVTVLAWMVIVFAGMSTVAGLLQVVLVSFLMPIPALSETDAREMPAMMRVMFANFHWMIYGSTLLSLLGLAAGVGLLKRKEWARIVMIGLLVLAAAGSAAAAIAQQLFVSAFFPEGADTPPDVQSFMLVMRIAAAIFGLAFVVIHSWLAVRLNSPAIRAEFS